MSRRRQYMGPLNNRVLGCVITVITRGVPAVAPEIYPDLIPMYNICRSTFVDDAVCSPDNI